MAQSAEQPLDATGWKNLFMENGIKEAKATEYGEKFVTEEMSVDILPQLDRDILKEMGVTIIGDALAILRIGGNIMSASRSPSVKAPAAKLPQISSDMTHQQFRKFTVDWNVFLTMTRPPASQIHAILYSCCDDAAQTAIINTYPGFFTAATDELLKKIEAIVTKKSNPTVHRMTFSGMMQQDNESVQAYVIRLKSSATDCEFACPSCKHDMSRIYIRDQVIRGLSNDVLQTDILAKADHLAKLEDVVKHSEAFEAALRDQVLMQEGGEAQHFRSEYRRQKLDKEKNRDKKDSPARNQKRPCSGCGSFSHGAPGSSDRKSKCPAWGKECYNCHLKNHFTHVCWRKQVDDADQEADAEALIAHVTFDHESDTFTSSRSNVVDEIKATLVPFSPKLDPRPKHNIPPISQS
jgi:hypothetical protein